MQANFKTLSLAQWEAIEQFSLNRRNGIKLQLKLKRLMDVVLSAVGVVMIAPLLVAIAIAVRLSSPGPILFRQERMGKFGQPFYIYKFRTMVDGSIYMGANINAFEGNPRITSVGKFLRDYHLDKLPQLFNVLRGEMSLVGPRPWLLSTFEISPTRQKKCLLRSPGMTGFEAVKKGLGNSPEKRIELDVWYVEHWFFGLDLWILLLTILVVLRKKGRRLRPQPSRSQLPGSKHLPKQTENSAPNPLQGFSALSLGLLVLGSKQKTNDGCPNNSSRFIEFC